MYKNHDEKVKARTEQVAAYIQNFPNGISRSELFRKFNWYNNQMREQIIAALMEDKRIDEQSIENGRRIYYPLEKNFETLMENAIDLPEDTPSAFEFSRSQRQIDKIFQAIKKHGVISRSDLTRKYGYIYNREEILKMLASKKKIKIEHRIIGTSFKTSTFYHYLSDREPITFRDAMAENDVVVWLPEQVPRHYTREVVTNADGESVYLPWSDGTLWVFYLVDKHVEDDFFMQTLADFKNEGKVPVELLNVIQG